MPRILAPLLAAPCLLILACCASPARSQDDCAPRASLLAALGEEYGERLSQVGMLANGCIVELLTAGGATWTLLVSCPAKDGVGPPMSCPLASGLRWLVLPQPAAAPGRGI